MRIACSHQSTSSKNSANASASRYIVTVLRGNKVSVKNDRRQNFAVDSKKIR